MGVFGSGVTASSIILRWQEGADNGKKILGYVVEGLNQYEDTWRQLKTSNLFKFILSVKSSAQERLKSQYPFILT